MSDPQLPAQVEAARAYEALFIPALFAQWAPKVADAARLAPGQRVLDVACGTGILAREARTRTAPSGYVAGVDPDAGMLAVAAELALSLIHICRCAFPGAGSSGSRRSGSGG